MSQVSTYQFKIQLANVNPKEPYLALSYSFGPSKTGDFYHTRLYGIPTATGITTLLTPTTGFYKILNTNFGLSIR